MGQRDNEERGARRHRAQWDQMAGSDAMWAVLSDPAKKFGGWDEDGFYERGRREIGAVLAEVRTLLPGFRPHRALDFGCGVGRTTLAIAAENVTCLGVDVSATMLATARAAARRAGVPAAFLQADGDALACLTPRTFDLVYSRYVLQHFPSRAAIDRALGSLAGLVAREGVLVLQLPSRLPWAVRLQPRRMLYRLLEGLGVPHETLYWKLGLHPMRMRAISEAAVADRLERCGLQLLRADAEPDDEYGYTDVTYFAARRATAASSNPR